MLSKFLLDDRESRRLENFTPLSTPLEVGTPGRINITDWLFQGDVTDSFYSADPQIELPELYIEGGQNTDRLEAFGTRTNPAKVRLCLLAVNLTLIFISQKVLTFLPWMVYR